MNNPLPDSSTPVPKHRRVDWLSVLLILATLGVLGKTAWQRFGPEPWPDPPRVGQTPPLIRLVELETGKSLILGYPRGQVLWITFWSHEDKDAAQDLRDLDAAWQSLKNRASFLMFAAASVSSDQAKPDLYPSVTQLIGQTQSTVPVALAPPKAQRAFGAQPSKRPLHILIDDKGKILAIESGRNPDIFRNFTKMVKTRLDQIEPFNGPRFARILPANRLSLVRTAAQNIE